MDIRHRMDWGPQYSFLVIKCEVLYLNENIIFRLNLLAYSLVRVAHMFCSLRVFFHETSPQWPFTGENVTGRGPSSYMPATIYCISR